VLDAFTLVKNQSRAILVGSASSPLCMRHLSINCVTVDIKRVLDDTPGSVSG